MNSADIPQTFESGWPVKTFTFTGEWAIGPRYTSCRVARRNNPDVERPIYRAEDGETIVLATVWRALKSRAGM